MQSANNFSMKTFIKKYYFYIVGALTGIANGLFGSGGGIMAVPLLSHAGFDQKKAQATSISITVILSIVSLCVYLFKGSVPLVDSLKYVLFGLLGAAIGSVILKKTKARTLKILFAVMLVISGARMIFK